MILWEDSIITAVAERVAAAATPDASLPWRCSHCGTEGSITKGPNGSETLDRLHSHHKRLAPDCEPRFIVVENGHVVVISDLPGTGPGKAEPPASRQ